MGLRPDAERGPRRAGHARQRRGETGEEVRRQVRGRKAPSWGGGGTASRSSSQIPPERVPESAPDPPRSPSRIAPRSPPRIPLELVPVPVRPARRRTSPSRVSSGTLGFTGSAARPSAGTHETGRRVPRSAPLLSAPLRSRPPSPSLGPGLAVVRPLAPRAWIDLVALASGSRNRPASTARLPIPGSQPARPPLALAHTRTARARCRLGILSKFPARACLRLCGPCLAASQVPKPVFIFGNVLEHDHRAHPIVLQTPFNGPTSTDPVIYRLSKWHVLQIG